MAGYVRGYNQTPLPWYCIITVHLNPGSYNRVVPVIGIWISMRYEMNIFIACNIASYWAQLVY